MTTGSVHSRLLRRIGSASARVKKGLALAIWRSRYLLRAIGLIRAGPQIWLFGGFGGTAFGDNSAVLLSFVQSREHAARPVWAIRREHLPSAPQTVETVEYGSVKAHVIALEAAVIVNSHGQSDISAPVPFRRLAGLKVMVGHGVLGLKRVEGPASLAAQACGYDLITATSEFEQSIHRKWCPSIRSVVTGKPRFDQRPLTASGWPQSAPGPDLLYIPTWRDWLVNPAAPEDLEEFVTMVRDVESQFAHAQSRFNTTARLTIQLHKNLPPYVRSALTTVHWSPNVHLAPPTTRIDHLINISDALITDYSSIAFDFLFMSRAVIFFQPDLDRYLKTRGWYLGEDTPPLFGPAARTLDTLFMQLSNLLTGGPRQYTDVDAFRGWRRKMFKHIDHDNCHRIVDAVKEHAADMQTFRPRPRGRNPLSRMPRDTGGD
jgi:CDP-glycerol glycerophosphotransferase (TagB/SpsB family)